MGKFKIYNSSAGSGKTYTLTKEYLKLALQEHNGSFSPDYFRRILAITFTNDAANEMKERVLNTLKIFAEGEDTQILHDISDESGISVDILRKRAELVFYKIIYNYADFSISTIDSFFNRITSAFTQELNVPFNYEIDLDTETLLKNVIDNVISKVGTEENPDLTNFVVEYASDQIDSGQNWKNIHRNLHKFSHKLLEEKSFPIMQGMNALKIGDFKDVIVEGKAFMEKFESEIQKLAKDGWQVIQKAGVDVDDFFQKGKGVGGYFQRQTEEEFEAKSFANSYVQAALTDDKWYSKTPNAHLIDSIKDQLKAYIEAIEDLREKNQKHYSNLKDILKHLYTVSLVNEIRQAFEFVKMRNNIVHISETNHKIAHIIQNEPVPFIYERLGEKYNHLLIDEFQDTSVLQWQNLLPLIENNLAEKHFNMLVGDAKQAIYRWRGGEMEQLVHIGSQDIDSLAPETAENIYLRERYEYIFSYLETQNLDTNYRSAREIVEFNNEFFEIITLRYQEAEAIYNENFKQKPSPSAPTGAGIQIKFLDKENYEEETLKQIEDIIEEARAIGFSWRDIAILCRKNSKAIQVATYLKEKGIEVISTDSLLLASDEKVNFIISLLKVIENPENNLAKSEALYLFYKVILKKIPDTTTNQEIHRIVYDPKSTIEDFYIKLAEEGYFVAYDEIQSLGIYEISEELLITFQIYEQHADKLEYIFRFMDWVLEFSVMQSNHLTDFLDEWEQKKNSICVSTPSNAEAVTITTIHRSKGLEYPVVILPFADWQVEPHYWDSMWINIEESDLPIADIHKQKMKHTLINIKKSVDDKAIDKQLFNERIKTIMENINLLYVALTRPIYLSYILTKKTDKSDNVSQWLKSFLENKKETNGESLWNPDRDTYSFGDFMPAIKPHKRQGDIPYRLGHIVSTNEHKKWKL